MLESLSLAFLGEGTGSCGPGISGNSTSCIRHKLGTGLASALGKEQFQRAFLGGEFVSGWMCIRHPEILAQLCFPQQSPPLNVCPQTLHNARFLRPGIGKHPWRQYHTSHTQLTPSCSVSLQHHQQCSAAGMCLVGAKLELGLGLGRLLFLQIWNFSLS